MFIEALVALSLFGIVIAAVAEVHQTVAQLSKTASQREEREKSLLAEHFKEPSTSSICNSNAVIPFVVKEVCCELELSIDSNKKTGRACKLMPDTGSSLLSLILASFLLMSLATLSYPTIRQLMIEREELRESHSEKLSILETEAELQRVVIDNQALRLPGATRLLTRTDPLVSPILALLNSNYRPDPNSSFLITTELRLKYLTLPASKSIRSKSSISFYSCGALPNNITIVAGFYLDHWDLLELLSQEESTLPGCVNGTHLTLKNRTGEVQDFNELYGLVPVKQSEIYYLDNTKTLRRYSLIQRKTTPIDYGYSKFEVATVENTFQFQLTKQNKFEERDFSFNIELEQPNADLFYSLLF